MCLCDCREEVRRGGGGGGEIGSGGGSGGTAPLDVMSDDEELMNAAQEAGGGGTGGGGGGGGGVPRAHRLSDADAPTRRLHSERLPGTASTHSLDSGLGSGAGTPAAALTPQYTGASFFSPPLMSSHPHTPVTVPLSAPSSTPATPHHYHPPAMPVSQMPIAVLNFNTAAGNTAGAGAGAGAGGVVVAAQPVLRAAPGGARLPMSATTKAATQRVAIAGGHAFSSFTNPNAGTSSNAAAAAAAAGSGSAQTSATVQSAAQSQVQVPGGTSTSPPIATANRSPQGLAPIAMTGVFVTTSASASALGSSVLPPVVTHKQPLTPHRSSSSSAVTPTGELEPASASASAATIKPPSPFVLARNASFLGVPSINTSLPVTSAFASASVPASATSTSTSTTPLSHSHPHSPVATQRSPNSHSLTARFGSMAASAAAAASSSSSSAAGAHTLTFPLSSAEAVDVSSADLHAIVIEAGLGHVLTAPSPVPNSPSPSSSSSAAAAGGAASAAAAPAARSLLSSPDVEDELAMAQSLRRSFPGASPALRPRGSTPLSKDPRFLQLADAPSTPSSASATPSALLPPVRTPRSAAAAAAAAAASAAALSAALQAQPLRRPATGGSGAGAAAGAGLTVDVSDTAHGSAGAPPSTLELEDDQCKCLYLLVGRGVSVFSSMILESPPHFDVCHLWVCVVL
jgi:hypothetical protein